MSHAVVLQVRIDADSDRDHRRSILNEFVLSEVRSLPGFQAGMCMNDHAGSGTCVVVFDTEVHAKDAIGPLTPAGGPPIPGCGVHEVDAEDRS